MGLNLYLVFPNFLLLQKKGINTIWFLLGIILHGQLSSFTHIYTQGRPSGQYICTTTFSTLPRNFGAEIPCTGVGVVQYTQMLQCSTLSRFDLPLFRADGHSYLYTYTVFFVKQKKSKSTPVSCRSNAVSENGSCLWSLLSLYKITSF